MFSTFGGVDNMLKGNQNRFCVKVIPIGGHPLLRHFSLFVQEI